MSDGAAPTLGPLSLGALRAPWLAMYATCLDYKTDQVHVPFILRRRRWQP
jgi:hypothetical protein